MEERQKQGEEGPQRKGRKESLGKQQQVWGREEEGVQKHSRWEAVRVRQKGRRGSGRGQS